MTIRNLLRLRSWRVWPELLALMPAPAAGFYIFGAQGAAVAAIMMSPLLGLALLRRTGQKGDDDGSPATAREVIVRVLDGVLRDGMTGRDSAACFAVALDDAQTLLARHGRTGYERLLRAAEDRILGAVRDGDVIRPLDSGRFAIAMAGRRRVDLESAIQIAARLQKRLAEPVSLDGATVHLSTSTGFCLPSRAPERTGSALLSAAEQALDEAWVNGPGAIRAYSAETGARWQREEDMRATLEAAFDNGEIVAFFQPQLSTDTGAVTGFEALARWIHPQRGILPPADFLPAVHASGLVARLNETVLTQALAALRSWGRAGHGVGTVAVNFSSEDLRDPNLVARIKWELDRFDLAPAGLTVEVLESVVADADHDVIVRNLTALAALGCGVDLDDFGTGHASIAAIRRFSVRRIKIDRSFVAGLDSDPEQQRIVAAILSMADQLGLKTLAEGVESLAEHALLAQLGCTHVQGFAIARPMPLQSTQDWLERHATKLARTPGLSGRAAS